LERNTGFEPATFALATQPGAIAKASQDSHPLPTPRNLSGRSKPAAPPHTQQAPAPTSVPRDFSTRFLPTQEGRICPAAGHLLSVKDAARALRVSTATVYKLCASGALPHLRVLNALRIAPTDLETYLARTRNGGHPKIW
jgi:excisionase family DNA binding protein